jgi:hypothetical protein
MLHFFATQQALLPMVKFIEKRALSPPLYERWGLRGAMS